MEIIERLANLEANTANTSSELREIKTYLGKRVEQHEDTRVALARIADKQDDMKAYQQKCDSERSDHEKRLTQVETFQSNQEWVAGKISALIAFAVSVIGVAVVWVKG